MFTQQSIDRFMKNVINNGPTECWGWKKSLDQDGYARVCFRYIDSQHTINMSGHRFMMVIQTGQPIPPGLVVMHSCDNPICCNPNHLSIGTVADNNLDKKLKGREKAPRGEKQPRALLTDEQAREIRRDAIVGYRSGRNNGSNLKELAAKYGVKTELVRRIAKGELYIYV
jgi:hypothetical protein